MLYSCVVLLEKLRGRTGRLYVRAYQLLVATPRPHLRGAWIDAYRRVWASCPFVVASPLSCECGMLLRFSFIMVETCAYDVSFRILAEISRGRDSCNGDIIHTWHDRDTHGIMI